MMSPFWSAPAERSDDGALALVPLKTRDNNPERRRAALATALQMLAPDYSPNVLRPDRHVQMLHSVRRQCIDDRIDDCRGRADSACFAYAFDAQWIHWRRCFGAIEFEPGNL